MSWKKFIPKEIQELYEIHDYKHAAAILSKEFLVEFKEICEALKHFRFSTQDIIAGGGNESAIPKIMSKVLRCQGWNERSLEAELVVYEVKGKTRTESHRVNHGTHKVDFLKGRIAFDFEWNSKDQTFDRDLSAFRSFFEYDAISVAVIVTRSTGLNSIFKELDIMKKYGASTTHMDKLIPRLEAGRNGGCPVLVFGITERQII